MRINFATKYRPGLSGIRVNEDVLCNVPVIKKDVLGQLDMPVHPNFRKWYPTYPGKYILTEAESGGMNLGIGFSKIVSDPKGNYLNAIKIFDPIKPNSVHALFKGVELIVTYGAMVSYMFKFNVVHVEIDEGGSVHYKQLWDVSPQAIEDFDGWFEKNVPFHGVFLRSPVRAAWEKCQTENAFEPLFYR